MMNSGWLEKADKMIWSTPPQILRFRELDLGIYLGEIESMNLNEINPDSCLGKGGSTIEP